MSYTYIYYFLLRVFIVINHHGIYHAGKVPAVYRKVRIGTFPRCTCAFMFVTTQNKHHQIVLTIRNCPDIPCYILHGSSLYRDRITIRTPFFINNKNNTQKQVCVCNHTPLCITIFIFTFVVSVI